MESLIFGTLCTIIIILAVKLYLIRKGLREIDDSLENILNQDTNRQITLSSRDRCVCRLAAGLNVYLGQLRKSQLKYSNGDRELKEAITNISHDLRTPLTAISGYLELLERQLSPEKSPHVQTDKAFSARKGTDSESREAIWNKKELPGQETNCTQNWEDNTRNTETTDVPHCLKVIRGRTDHMKRLTEELFRYSLALSIPEEKAQPVSLNRALEECILSFYGPLREKGISPAVSLPENPVIRTLDPGALARILQNVLSNAVKYSGGDLEICLSEQGTITCSNTAPNLNPLHVEHLFDRYYTVESISLPDGESSTGLGLSIARLLTERLGGEISAACRLQPVTPDSPSQSHTAENRLEITIRFPA